MSIRTCSVDGCEKKHCANSLCRMHYFRARRHGITSPSRTAACATCGEVFEYIKKSGPNPKYCSDQCRLPKLGRAAHEACVICGKPSGVLRGLRRYCSRLCQTEAYRYPDGKPARDCVQCGDPIDFDQTRPGGRKLRADTRKCFKCRRNQRYAMTASQLAERDGVQCSICAEPVDLTLKWPHRLSPSIDHIHPYSLGGGNEASNLALAHLTCNISKKNRVA